MPPKAKIFKEDIIHAAMTITERNGIRALTSRNIANELGTSTRPVYLFFNSMEELQKQVMIESRNLLLEYARRDYTDRVFLNIGTGYACFARDHKELFRILFLENDKSKKVVTGILDSLREMMKADIRLIGMTQDERDLLLDKMWTYAHGLASMVCVGLIEDSTEHIISMLDQMGSVVITAAIKESQRDPRNF